MIRRNLFEAEELSAAEAFDQDWSDVQSFAKWAVKQQHLFGSLALDIASEVLDRRVRKTEKDWRRDGYDLYNAAAKDLKTHSRIIKAG